MWLRLVKRTVNFRRSGNVPLLLCGRDRNSRHDSHIFPRHGLVVVEVGHSDTDYTTCLQVPSVGLVVAGDVTYNERSPLSRRVERANPL